MVIVLNSIIFKKKLLVFYVLIKFMCGPTSQHLGVMI